MDYCGLHMISFNLICLAVLWHEDYPYFFTNMHMEVQLGEMTYWRVLSLIRNMISVQVMDFNLVSFFLRFFKDQLSDEVQDIRNWLYSI